MGARKFVLPRIRHLVAVQDPARRHLAAGALTPRGGLPRGPPVEQARIVREALTGR